MLESNGVPSVLFDVKRSISEFSHLCQHSYILDTFVSISTSASYKPAVELSIVTLALSLVNFAFDS